MTNAELIAAGRKCVEVGQALGYEDMRNYLCGRFAEALEQAERELAAAKITIEALQLNLHVADKEVESTEAELAALREGRGRLATCLDAILDIGVYPKEVIHANGENTVRTPWQDGWNACTAKMHELSVSLLKDPDAAIDAARKV